MHEEKPAHGAPKSVGGKKTPSHGRRKDASPHKDSHKRAEGNHPKLTEGAAEPAEKKSPPSKGGGRRHDRKKSDKAERHAADAEKDNVKKAERLDAQLRTGDRDSQVVPGKQKGAHHDKGILPHPTHAAAKALVSEKKGRQDDLLHDHKGIKVKIVEPRPRRICTVRGANPEPILREYWKHVLVYVFLWYVVIAVVALSHQTICWAPSPCYLPTCGELQPSKSDNSSSHGAWEWTAHLDDPKVPEYVIDNMDRSLWEPTQGPETQL